ncbi:MAG: hypothetical protein O2960_08025 [Verrucomicrobia bacterium]|nr:hypothetical protein [Verrucomicrobiota bacterium]
MTAPAGHSHVNPTPPEIVSGHIGPRCTRARVLLALAVWRASLLIGACVWSSWEVSAQPHAPPTQHVAFVLDDNVSAPVRHGLGKLRIALEQMGVRVDEGKSVKATAHRAVVVAGLTSGQGEAAKLIADERLAPHAGPESLLIRKLNHEDKTVILAAGADERGLMYALQDVAERVGWAKPGEGPFTEVRDVQEKPFTPERQRVEFRPAGEIKPAPLYTTAASDGDQEAPTVVHRAVTTAPLGKPLTITAEVRDPSGVKWVRLRYRSVNQHQDYETLPMLATEKKDQYLAAIPAEDIVPAWDLMYFIEVMDKQGNGRIHPDFNQETPYIVVNLQR